MSRTQFRNLTISNAFIFSAAMADEEICRRVIELALGIPIAKVHVCTEKTMVYHPEYHGVRLDVYAADDKNTRFNIEMQVVFQRWLPKRDRYYHSQLDMDLLSVGESYENLPDTYVIFICDFDPFGKGLYRYTCETRCCEENFPIQNGTKSIYLNTKGRNSQDVQPELVEFLRYIRATQEECEGEFYDPFVKHLQEKVRRIKDDRSMEERYMLLEEMMRNERKAGILEGRRREKAECVIALLETKGEVTSGLRSRIESEESLEKLSQWLLLAAGSASPEDFAKKM